MTPAQLIDISGRGRTSAVGCHTFFDGGLVVDAGQAAHPTSNYLPSLQPNDRRPSLRLGRWGMPADWMVSLIFSDAPSSVTPADEVEFFAKSTPTDPIDTLDQVACVYHGIVPAVMESDLSGLAVSLQRFQSQGFKAREIAAQPPAIRAALAGLWSAGFTAGLSSLGPTVFVVTAGANPDLEQFTPPRTEVLGPFSFRNDGFDISTTYDRATDRTDP